MFEKAVIAGIGPDSDVDLGLIAETLLFYEHVHIVFNATAIETFIRQVGVDAALDLFQRDNISATYVPGFVGVHSSKEGGVSLHSLIQGKMIKKADGRKITDRKDLLEKLSLSTGLARDSAKLEKLRRKINLHNIPDDERSITRNAMQLLKNQDFVQSIPNLVLSEIYPDLDIGTGYEFSIREVNGKFLFNTNLDFDRLNLGLRDIDPSSEYNITPAKLVTHLLNSESDAYFAANDLAEIVTRRVNAKIITKKFASLLSRRTASEEQLKCFEYVTIAEGRTVREVINSGERTFSDFLSLLDKADNFRDWIHGLDSNSSLLHEYHDAITKDSWLGSLPIKAFKFALFQGVGLCTTPIVGVTLSAADTFFMDKILQGWKPSQFICGPVRQFTR